MESHEDSCVAAAGSLFLSLDYPHEVDHQLNLLAKEEQHASAHHHHHHDHDDRNDDSMQNDKSDNHINTMMQGGMLFDMLSTMHFSAAGNMNNRNDLGMDASSYNQQQAAADHQGWQVADQQGGFDPICFLKLPVLATQNPGNVPDQGHNYLPYYNNNAATHNINQQRDYALSLSNYWSSSMQTEDQEYSMSCSTTVDDIHHGRMIMQGFDNPDHHHDNNNMDNDEIDAMTCGEGGDDQRLEEAGRDEIDGSGYHHHHHGAQQLQQKAYNVGPGGPTAMKAKRKRTRACKNSEEIESQRMTHIAVERNRRRQMNEHLRVLRALMPPSYVQRGDQASIIGGAIEFVKELEQLLQCLESQKRRRMYSSASTSNINNAITPSNANDLSLTMRPTPAAAPPAMMSNNGVLQLSSDHITAASSLIDISGGAHAGAEQHHLHHLHPQQNIISMSSARPPPVASCHSSMLDSLFEPLRLEDVAEARSAMADIEVKLLGCDAIIKILSQRRPRQLLNTIAALEELRFTIFHTNVTTIDHTVLYSFTVKVGHIDQTSTAKDIATSVQQIFINLIQNPIDQLLD